LLARCGKNPNHIKEQCGLPISTYFSALKVKWLMDNVLQVKDAIKEDRCAFGTVDSWLLWVKLYLF
jgi:glycerol kinase